MQLTRDDQARLLEALERLASGDDRGFEDILWLAFGDDWRPMLRVLARSAYVEIAGADRATPRLTGRGQSLIGQLRGATAAAAS